MGDLLGIDGLFGFYGALRATEFFDVALLVSGVSVLIRLAVFEAHRFITQGTDQLAPPDVVQNSIE